MIPELDVRCPVPGRGGLPILASAAEGAPVRRPRIAVFSLTGCEGCSLTILEQEQELLALLDAVEIVNFREIRSIGEMEDIDIGFVDGAVSTPHDAMQARRFRKACRVLVAIGACACLGGVNTLKHQQPAPEYRRAVYGDRAIRFPTADAQPLSAVVRVEYELPGCPMIGAEFLRFVQHALSGRPFRLPMHPVCVECKQRGNLCLYEKGELCLGPVTRAGCAAICTTYGARCEGCRGLLGGAQLQTFLQNAQSLYGAAPERVLERLRLFGAFQENRFPESSENSGHDDGR